MYKTSESLEAEGFEIGRARGFTAGWLERESVFMHMEFKYILELIKNGLYKQFFEDIGISKEERVDEEKQISNLQKYFLNCFKEKIEKAESKKELTDLVYELRYYEQLPYKNEAIFNEIKNKDLLGNIEEKLINKACAQKCLVMFSKEISLNKKILENQFKTKIINLENTVYILKYQKGILKVEIYDTNIEESLIEIPILKKVELEVRLNKKIKIWE